MRYASAAKKPGLGRPGERQRAAVLAPTAAFLISDNNRDRLAEPYRPNLNVSANEERSTTGSLWTGVITSDFEYKS